MYQHANENWNSWKEAALPSLKLGFCWQKHLRIKSVLKVLVSSVEARGQVAPARALRTEKSPKQMTDNKTNSKMWEVLQPKKSQTKISEAEPGCWSHWIWTPEAHDFGAEDLQSWRWTEPLFWSLAFVICDTWHVQNVQNVHSIGRVYNRYIMVSYSRRCYLNFDLTYPLACTYISY